MAVSARGRREQCADEIAAISDAARGVRKDIIVLCHGGPIAMPDDARFILDRVKQCHGFYGASSMERLPVEAALTDTTRRFTRITRSPAPGDSP